MKLAQCIANSGIEEIKAAFDGGKLTLYSVARPVDPGHPVDRSGALATFTFASPAFDQETNGNQDEAPPPRFAANPVMATGTGTPGFARIFQADGTPLADLSAGPGNTEIKLTEVSTTANYPVTLTRMQLRLR